MIKIEYKQKPEKWQPYDMETNIILDEDITASDAIRAFLRVLNIATYRITLNSLKNLVENLEDEGYTDDDRIM